MTVKNRVSRLEKRRGERVKRLVFAIDTWDDSGDVEVRLGDQTEVRMSRSEFETWQAEQGDDTLCIHVMYCDTPKPEPGKS